MDLDKDLLGELLRKITAEPPEWFTELTKNCKELNLEVAAANGKVYIICPKTPAKDVQQRVTANIPEDVEWEFKENPKEATLQMISTLVQRSGATKCDGNSTDGNSTDGNSTDKPHFLALNITGSSPELDEFYSATWNGIIEALKNDDYFDSWDLKLNGTSVHVYDRKISEEVARNTKRNFSINSDDIMNLKINLGTINTIDELIASL